MNSRLSIVTSLGAVVALLGGLTPACGSDGNTRLGKILEGGTAGAGGRGNAAGGAAGSTAGNAGSTGSSSLIGQRCLKDSECGTDGLTCLAVTGNEFAGGGVSNGICSLDCSDDLLSDVAAEGTCGKIDDTSICLGLSAVQAYCVESCTLGTPSATEMKCHNRKDMACADPREVGLGYCQPTCRGDFDCKGRICDLGNGVCIDKLDPSRKLPIGAKCDPKAVVDPCMGACVGIIEGDASTPTTGFCSGFCQLGEQNGCGFDPQATTVDSFCLYQPSRFSGQGDIGFCAQVCDCNDDCLNPDFICSNVDGLSDVINRPGACGTANSASDKGIACSGTRPKPDAKAPVSTPEAGVVDAGAPPPVDAGQTD